MQGQSLTADPGSWSGSPAPTFAYQWRQCDAAGQNCADIASATAAAYQLAAGDVGATVRVVVTGSNSAGQASAASAVSAVVAAAPVAPTNTALPSLSGSAVQGQSLTADPGSWSGSPAPTFAYQWRQCDAAGQNCADIASATTASYQLAAGDVGATVRVVVTGSNSAGQASAASAVSAVVAAAPVAPTNTVLPSLSGSAVQGQSLTADPGSWSGSPAPTFAYQWRQCDAAGQNCADIASATAASYQLAAGDVGATVRVVVTGSNSAGQASAASAVSAVVAAAPVAPQNTVLPSLSGSAVQGQSLVGGSGQLVGVAGAEFCVSVAAV